MPQLAGTGVLLLGACVLLGWMLDVAVLKRILPGLATMKANTAIGFALAGAALLAIDRGRNARPAALAAGALGLATLAQDLCGVSLGIDELLFRDAAGTPQSGAPGRMSPGTAFNFVLLGTALALHTRPSRLSAWVAQWFALLALVLALVATIGYLYHVEALYRVEPYSSMALHTALGFVLLAAGALAVRPAGWMWRVASPGPGGIMLRQLFLPATLGLIVIGWLRVEAESRGWIETGIGTALMVIVAGLLFGALALRCARALDAERSAARHVVGSLSQRLLRAEESERRALSRELHDRVGQNLSALNLNLQLIRRQISLESAQRVSERLDEAQQLLQHTTRDVRNVMVDLRPPGLDDYGLATALRNYAERIEASFPARLGVSGADPQPRLHADAEIALFRIAQEALNNAAKHAAARAVDVRLDVGERGVRMTIADDGAGFDPERSRGGASWGLATMRERAEAVGALLRIDAAPGRGTRITVDLARP